jgi:hypothetical protein
VLKRVKMRLEVVKREGFEGDKACGAEGGLVGENQIEGLLLSYPF